LLPPAFFWFIGTVTSGFGGDDKAPDAPALALRVEQHAGFLADELETRLEAAGFDVVRPDEDPDAAAFDNWRRRLVVPSGFTDAVLGGDARPLELRRLEGGLAADLDGFRARRAVWGLLADLIALDTRTEPITPEALDELRTAERALAIQVEATGRRREVPSGFQQAVPGTMVMFTLVILLTSGASTLIVERRQGVLRRLAAAPIPRAFVFWGKWLGKYGLAAVQIGFAVLLGSLAFGVDWGPEPLGIALVLAAYAALISSLGLLLGNVARTEPQAIAIAILAGNVLAALGGCWWPIEITPDWMQALARFTPTGAAMHGLHALMSFGAPLSAVTADIAGLALGALAIGTLAARRMRFQ
jgi:ABC-2 type transport system permease protein